MNTITPKIYGDFLIRVAEMYTDFNRAIMEYIDNSIDSAEFYYDHINDSYQQEISIEVTTQKDKIIVWDNCTGIHNLNSLIETIGNSDKKGDFATNGQFGFGIFSCLSGCTSLEFYSKHEESNQGYYLRINKGDFENKLTNDIKINSCIKTNDINNKGTKVILSNFNKDIIDNLNEESIRDFISNHFELILTRKRFCIRLNGTQIPPFDYNKIKGDTWSDEIKEAVYIPRKQKEEHPEKSIFRLKHPIEIYLKMCEDQEIRRPPAFFIKGRRINEVKSISSFKSYYGSKRMLWGHSQITGYIDLKDNFEPTLKRDDFKDARGHKFKAFNEAMKEHEQLIYDYFIVKKNAEKQSKTLNKVAKEFENILNKLPENELSFQTISLSQEPSAEGYLMEEGYGKKDRHGEKPRKGNMQYGLSEGDGSGPNLDKKGDDIFKSGKEKKNRSGFNIEFSEEEPVKTVDGKSYVRSTLQENVNNNKTIVIYKKHDEFKRRCKTKKVGDLEITSDLINYIASEIAIHYQDEYYKKQRKIDRYEKSIFEEFTELVYKIEKASHHLVGKSAQILNEK